ncbi:hypothetical protein AAFC00_002267 [Neodothiora populina]|uniref:Potassium channel domain-containing protein n=1 Tax=Neodothiora populina TaxID=2781224 RepID=A0ABR3PGU9_9PEZI
MDCQPPPSDSSRTAIVGKDDLNIGDIGSVRHAWTERPGLSGVGAYRSSTERRTSLTRESSKILWKFKLRPWDDDQERDWWFAGTAIPLLAATLGPLANVLSIAALVTYWRMCLIDGVDPATCPSIGVDTLLAELYGHTFEDPKWCYDLNVVSLVAGFVGNIFLLFNFTGRVRYMISLPVTILSWYLATGILMAITISMDVYVAPMRPQQTYTQGFWYAVIAAVLYMVASMLLMINMLGYFLGHYPQQFNLTDSQRTLILQTMLFFIWLAGGAGVFSTIETKYGNGDIPWSYVNALYFCDVTILTVGFGDLYPTSDTGRGLVFPYSVGGIVMLGLMISSITKFASELGQDKVLQKHVERSRTRTVGRAVTTSIELQERERVLSSRPVIPGPLPVPQQGTPLRIIDNKEELKKQAEQVPSHSQLRHGLRRMTGQLTPFKPAKKSRLLLLREEKDRFDAMRNIQRSTAKWKRWYSLVLSVMAFGILWCIGAVTFWQAEKREQGITYFQSLYLCYVSLLTIGYGDLAPRSNAGRPFFVVWSLVAVPTMTILITEMSDTIIGDFKKATSGVAGFTVLPERGVWHRFLDRQPWLLRVIARRRADKDARLRLQRGFEVGPDPEDPDEGLNEEAPTLATLAAEDDDGNGPVKKPSDFDLARRLARAIRRTANDLRADPPRRYSYEEWVELTRLIRFTSHKGHGEAQDESVEEGLVEWDWIGEDSPMMAQESEAEFVLDRLCESMGRYIRRLASPEDDDDDEGGERQAPSSADENRAVDNVLDDDNDDTIVDESNGSTADASKRR